MVHLKKEDIAFDFIKKCYTKHGFSFFEGIKLFNLNIWGIRSLDLETDKYNDLIGVSWIYGNKVSHHVFNGTTDTGLYYLNNPMNSKGTAIVVHNKQYRGVYALGRHGIGTAGEHEALRQVKPMDYWRDNNRDNYRDIETGQIYTEIAYTNLHSRPPGATMLATIGKTSAGCQVIASPSEFHNTFIPIIKEAIKYWGNSFSYTLFFERDLLDIDSVPSGYISHNKNYV